MHLRQKLPGSIIGVRIWFQIGKIRIEGEYDEENRVALSFSQ
jgi:hypothetical protein